MKKKNPKVYVFFDTRDGEVKGWTKKKWVRDALLDQRPHFYARRFRLSEYERYMKEQHPSSTLESMEYDIGVFDSIILTPGEEEDFYLTLAESAHYDNILWELGTLHTHLYFRPKGMQINFLVLQKTEREVMEIITNLGYDGDYDRDPADIVDETPLLVEYLGIEEWANGKA